MNLKQLLAHVAMLAVLPAVALVAQTRMERAVIGEGGGRASSSSTVMECTVGQTAAQRATGSGTDGQFGFWHMALIPSAVPSAYTVESAVGLAVAPNPLVGRGAISLTMARAADVELALYDPTGRRVSTVFSGTLGAGRHSIPLNADHLPAGAYYLAANTAGSLVTHDVVIVH